MENYTIAKYNKIVREKESDLTNIGMGERTRDKIVHSSILDSGQKLSYDIGDTGQMLGRALH